MIEEKVDKMFDDIGTKIQRLSKIFFVLCVLASAMGSIAMFIYMLDEEGLMVGLVYSVLLVR